MASATELLRRFEIPGRVSIIEGNGEMPKVEVKSDAARAEIYLHGAHVTDFQLDGQRPLLFVSRCSRFARHQPIRGGIPIILPWFGSREGEPAHGFARLVDWNLHETVALPDGGATLRFSLPETSASAMWPPFTANYVVTLTDKLTLELIVTNGSRNEAFSFENCLHTYFHIEDIAQVSITGLKGASYLDKVENYTPKTETSDAIEITSEVDRTYLDTMGTVEIHDRALRRKILVEKAGSSSTVVWNPWIAKSQQMPDFGDDEYKQMVCVESGNVSRNKIVLPPGRSSVLRVVLSSVSL
ncbi:MAG TPA: D-hexose-6-phosphate mutarotase [Candidatus Limnocylindria bacterium]|nr:D-hexose-6-phosphate mutarotase [Candidatus Limnocylindria bacterium]